MIREPRISWSRRNDEGPPAVADVSNRLERNRPGCSVALTKLRQASTLALQSINPPAYAGGTDFIALKTDPIHLHRPVRSRQSYPLHPEVPPARHGPARQSFVRRDRRLPG